jgi:hypothetical protein
MKKNRLFKKKKKSIGPNSIENFETKHLMLLHFVNVVIPQPPEGLL